MEDSCELQVAEKIRPYLDEIAERLYAGHASAMIGAGFSKNARAARTGSPGFPSWNELADVFYRKLHGRIPDPSEPNSRYLNPLKLAEEVCAAFGRPVLEQLLRDNLPDSEYEPSELHVQLLELKWNDVFTTNYDTLLERASESVVAQRYDIVVNKEDLVYATRPRIVKLHGSCPSERPFIISEEDYRQYPRVNGPFVNTVQQALVENSLCMFVFSADDPNFLQWIGWIRDNLGVHNSSRLYLVGVLHFSAAQIQLLAQRNITVVDMDVCNGVSGDHKKGLELFVTYLKSKKKDPLAWDVKVEGSRNLSLQTALEKYRNERREYPNWAILPADKRRSISLWASLDYPFRHLTNDTEPPADIDFLYEVNWRLERGLHPITEDDIGVYERVLERYNPYPAVITVDAATVRSDLPEYSVLPWNEISLKWNELQIAVLRAYRETWQSDNWKILNDRLNQAASGLTPEQIARWRYERSLFSLFSFDLAALKEELANWPENDALPLWEARRAGIMAEMGDLLEAERILENALTITRKKQHLSAADDEYTWVSQESLIMMTLRAVKLSTDLVSRSGRHHSKIIQEFQERWDTLRTFKCDPWAELSRFEVQLTAPPRENHGLIRKKSFDLGKENITRRFASRDEEAEAGYTLLRYYEEVGLPLVLPHLNIGSKEAVGATTRIAAYSPYWALVTLLRLGEKGNVDSIYDRMTLARMSSEEVDKQVAQFLDMLERSRIFIDRGDLFHNHNLAIRMAQVIPEILSRLCTKCSPEVLMKLIELVEALYAAPKKYNYDGLRSLVGRLMTSLPPSSLLAIVDRLLDIPIVADPGLFHPNGHPDPFTFISLPTLTGAPPKKTRRELTQVNDLVVAARSPNPALRCGACTRLLILYDAGFLGKNQSKRFFAALWSQRADNGFPHHVDFYKSVYLRGVHPSTVDPVALFKKYTQSAHFSTEGESERKGVAITGGRCQLAEEVLRASKRPIWGGAIGWSTEECEVLLTRLIEWWNSEKDHLKEEEVHGLFGDIREEYLGRFEHLVKLLADVVGPGLSKQTDSSLIEALAVLLDEMDDYGVPSLRARAACIRLFPGSDDAVLSRVCSTIASTDRRKATEAIWASFTMLRECREPAPGPPWAVLLESVSQQIKWRRQVALVQSMEMMRTVVERLPHLLSQNLLSDILTGLDFLCEENSSSVGDAYIDFEDILANRQSAASLAHSLFRYYLDAGQDVPNALLVWREICGSPNEFADVRNQWLSSGV